MVSSPHDLDHSIAEPTLGRCRNSLHEDDNFIIFYQTRNFLLHRTGLRGELCAGLDIDQGTGIDGDGLNQNWWRLNWAAPDSSLGTHRQGSCDAAIHDESFCPSVVCKDK